jgi:dTDP-glucose 4,6-dehydratase
LKSLVTGGAGFIGSEFVRQLLKIPNHEIVVIDSLRYSGSLKNLDDIKFGIEFIQMDIRNKQQVRKLFSRSQFDSVINFAAETHVDNSISGPGIFSETNIIGTSNLLESCNEFKTNLFFQISTDEVYGSMVTGLANEHDKLKPSSPYSASKASAELLVNAFAHTYSLNTLIARCSNNYGPYQYPEKFIPVAIKHLMNENQVPVYGNGLNVREWIYVTDTCTALIEILLKGRYGEIYNVSSGNFKSNIEIVHKLCELMGLTDNKIDFVQDRLGHDFRYAIDSSKIRNELKWEAKTNLDEGLSKTIEWYENNSERFNKW